MGKTTCSLSDWLDWVQRRLEVPEDLDQVYVVDYDYKFRKSDQSKIKSLKCFMTTKRLINNARKGKQTKNIY